MKRRAAIMVVVLVCLGVVAIIGGSLVQKLVIGHRQEQLRADQLQAFWLAESGVQRALAKLARDDSYQGELWLLGGDDLGRPESRASVNIEVRSGATMLRRQQLTVQAIYMPNPDRQSSYRYELMVTERGER